MPARLHPRWVARRARAVQQYPLCNLPLVMKAWWVVVGLDPWRWR